jgi:hypothetical protein
MLNIASILLYTVVGFRHSVFIDNHSFDNDADIRLGYLYPRNIYFHSNVLENNNLQS